MKSLPAYSVTMLTRIVTSENEMQKSDRGDYTSTRVVVVHRRLYSALALGPAPQVLECLLVLSTGYLLPRILLR